MVRSTHRNTLTVCTVLILTAALIELRPASAEATTLLALQSHSVIEGASTVDDPTGVDFDDVDLFSAGPFPLTHNPRLSAVGAFGSSILNMDLETSFGRLSARLDARSSVDSVPFDVLSRTITIDSLSWTDTFTVLSPTLAPGTSVDIVARLSLTGNVSNAGLTSLIVDTTEILERSLQAGLLIGVATENILFDVSSTLREPFTTFNEFGSTVFTVNVGDSFDISSFLQFGTTTLAFNDPTGFGFEPISNLLVDASNSARFGIEVLTAGASLGSDSGTVYPTDPARPVPEPSTMLLLLSGLAGLGIFRRRRQRKEVS